MDSNTSIITSINNVRHLVNNSILMLRDLDTALSKHGFQPLNGNALGTETSKNINQSMVQYQTFFPQYMARPYALTSDILANKVNKIIFTNIQFYHSDYEDLPPALVNSVMLFPEYVEDAKKYVQNWWLKFVVYEDENWEDVKKHGELNENIDEEGFKTIFWCQDLLSIDGQRELLQEAERLVQVFFDK
ncbi:hypothetical protein [Peribacillus sp. Hz7]|uniref:hypothetical protein n=1 Tax=Peribacillus sp. Hz7 TaxID=3344873 RepID=UPI0035CB4B73